MDLFAKEIDILGLKYIPSFISAEEEKLLIQLIDQQPWLTDLKRRVQHYGWKYDYKARKITDDLRIGELPEWLVEHSKKLKEENLFEDQPDQVIINEYLPGQGISAHIDCLPCFGDTIASLSLGSNCIMEFSRDSRKERLQLEPCSLVILTDEARYKWQHSIPARKSDKLSGISSPRSRRLSLTFRTVIT